MNFIFEYHEFRSYDEDRLLSKMLKEGIDLRGITDSSLKKEELDARRSALRASGFSDKWITALQKQKPALYHPATLMIHLQWLEKRGFTNPQRVVKYYPSILGFTFKNIDDKLERLEERGFTNPRKMVESFPPVLGLTLKNIDRRIKLINKLIALYNIQLTARTLLEKQNMLLSSKVDKIIILARVLRKTAQTPQNVTESAIKRFLFSNLEDVLVALDTLSNKEVVTSSELLRMAKQVKASKSSKEDKKECIIYGLHNDPKIKHAYLRGYATGRQYKSSFQ